ncbi:MRN complex-interacting protein isoform X2 [Oxyura jamaicensis]|uniref:MRN complex-interacting protein isoform X2 n=1 Tax=Oxyura jamaicensis TaxID=8884 RepID=UPI0015A53338|nr:MRN complex-interacting protein isoform X2 [Oxyura jamaicensis]
MAAPCWVLRCCSCRLFQAQQAKRSAKWSCSVCGQRQALLKVYGRGSGRDCRHHVQKLNSLQGEAEEAIARTTRCIEESVNDNENIAARGEDSSVQQEGRIEVSRWSKYLDKGSEDQEEEEEESTERQQFCSQRKNAVEEQRKQRKRFLYSDVQEHSEENGAFQLAYQAKKHKKCSIPVPDQGDGNAVSADSIVPAVCQSVVLRENTQPPTACTKPSKWEKFLSCSDDSENAARVTLSPQDGSGRLGLHRTTAVSIATGCTEEAQSALPPSTGFKFRKSSTSTEQLALKPPGSMLPSNSCSQGKDALVKEPQSQLLRAGTGILDAATGPPTTPPVKCNTGPKPSSISRERLFCTGEEFDDDF